MLRRTKDQVAIDLPPKQEQVLTLELSARHRKIYDTRLARERQKVLGLLGDWEKNRFQVFRSLSVLRQLSLHAMLVDDTHHGVSSAKVEYLTEQLPELIAEGHTALVFSQFTRFLHILTTHLDKVGIAYSYLDGSMNAAQRADAVARFTGGRTQVFLISLKAAVSDSTSPRPTTASSAIRGGIRPPRRRPLTGHIASGSNARSPSTGWCRPTPSKNG